MAVKLKSGSKPAIKERVAAKANDAGARRISTKTKAPKKGLEMK